MTTLSVVTADSDSPDLRNCSLSNEVTALEQIRRMRGGSQSHLMRCSDQAYYVVKFQNNPQHRRILINEFLGTKLAERLGLPAASTAIVNVSEQLIQLTDELMMQYSREKVQCQPGLHFGSRYPGDPRRVAAFDFLPDPELCRVTNLDDFAGMLVFDKWTCNTDGRQTVFVQDRSMSRGGLRQSALRPYRTVMIDQGFCFNAGEWDFPDAPLRGLYARSRAYTGVTGMDSFGPWLERLEQFTDLALAEIVGQMPIEWYEADRNALSKLCERLLARRARVPDLIQEARRSNRQPFPNWPWNAVSTSNA